MEEGTQELQRLDRKRKERERLAELQSLMPYTPEYHCDKCGALLSKPTLKLVAYEILGGSPIFQGSFNCPNYRFWKPINHTRLLLEVHAGEMTVFKEKGLGHRRFGELHEYQLEEYRDQDRIHAHETTQGMTSSGGGSHVR